MLLFIQQEHRRHLFKFRLWIESRVFPISSIRINSTQRKPVRFDSTDDEDERHNREKKIGYASECCCCTSTNGFTKLVHGANENLTLAINTFSQFDVIVFGDGIASSSHGDHANTQIIIQSLNNLGKLSFGYIDLGVTTKNLSILQMQTTVDDWQAMEIKGILWDDAGYDYGVTRSRQNTMISYCHSLNLGVMMNA
ncbi:unnamed protein product [Rotaria sp. Silwood2]|nr:unnamed protein product [Rotaria sp. Silwood2]